MLAVDLVVLALSLMADVSTVAITVDVGPSLLAVVSILVAGVVGKTVANRNNGNGGSNGTHTITSNNGQGK